MHMKIDGTIYDADAIREMDALAECAADEINRLRAALNAMTAERDAARAKAMEDAAEAADSEGSFKVADAIRAMIRRCKS